MKIHCFFEQSGTFKNEFKKLGYQAYDYDICNKFYETDTIIDLFEEIENAYLNKKSIFDKITKEDIIMAFFPCIRFTSRMQMNFLIKRNLSDIEKIQENMKYFDEMNNLYSLFSKLIIVCIKKQLKIIIENPYNKNHILTKFFHIKPKIIDIDRTRRGDNYVKPTQYWFINCEPKNNFITEPIIPAEIKKVEYQSKIKRSMINKNYAKRFIKEFII